MSSKKLCFECNHPERDHPLIVLTQGYSSVGSVHQDGTMEVSYGEARVYLAGRSWKYEKFCSEFEGTKQLELF